MFSMSVRARFMRGTPLFPVEPSFQGLRWAFEMASNGNWGS